MVDLALALEVVDSPRVEETYRTALAIYEKLVADYPDNVEYRIGEALCLRNLGPFLAVAKRPEEAEASYHKALAVLESRDGQPQTVKRLQEQALVLNNLGELESSIGRPEAEKSLRAAMNIFEGLVDRGPASREHRHYLAIAQNNLGDSLLKLHRFADAAPYFARSAAIFEKLVAEVANEIDLRSHFGIVLEGQGNMLLETGKPAEAKKAMEGAIAQQRQAMRLSKNSDSVRALLGGHLIALARINLKLGAVEEAAANAIELPKIVPTSDRGQACLDAARILAQLVAQIEANTRLPEAERNRLIRNYLGRTMVLVTEGTDGSPKRSDEIKKDPHIKALESRPEFQTIMNALESATVTGVFRSHVVAAFSALFLGLAPAEPSRDSHGDGAACLIQVQAVRQTQNEEANSRTDVPAPGNDRSVALVPGLAWAGRRPLRNPAFDRRPRGGRAHGSTAPILPGHEPKGPVMPASSWCDWATASEAAFDALAAAGGPVVVIGFSTGGTLALRLATRRPVARMVLLAPFLAIRYSGLIPLRPASYLRHIARLIPNLPRRRPPSVTR